jgi:AAA+ superfamily predicted ATPase
VCAGDLGTDAERLERNLLEIASLAHKWGAIILIDEADVYLAERSLQDILRNSLVSVFLRHLEYFQGIMFLTTNRLTTFDAAFQSRIHFAMKFGDLTPKAKKKIWETFLQKAPTETKISEAELGELSRKNINGRQVRWCQLCEAYSRWRADRHHHPDQELCADGIGFRLMERGMP